MMTNPIRIRHRRTPTPPGSEAPVACEQVPAASEPGDPAQGPSAVADPDQASTYAVGFGKPPHHTRFQAGHSGNPRGRPKGSRSIGALVIRELDQRVTVRENGQTQRIRKRDLMAKQLVKKAAEGDLKALAQIMRIVPEAEASAQSTPGPNAEAGAFTPERDREILAQFMATLGRGDAEPANVDEGQGQ